MEMQGNFIIRTVHNICHLFCLHDSKYVFDLMQDHNKNTNEAWQTKPSNLFWW